MKTRRWVKTVLIEAKKVQVDMPWTRSIRAARRAEKPRLLKAAR